MTDAVETMAYANEVPWHGLGNPVDANLSPAEMATAAGIDWKVELKPLYLQENSNLIQLPANKALVRVTDQSVLSVVGGRYIPTQNEDVMDFFSKFTRAGGMTMETAGSLMGGKFIWGLASVNQQFVLPGNDENRAYLLLCNSHIPGYALTADFTSVRVVCWNTLTMALNNLSSRAFKMVHTREFNGDQHAIAERALGMVHDANQKLADQAMFLAQHNVPNEEVLKDYLMKVFALSPSQLTVRQLADEATEAAAGGSVSEEETEAPAARAPRTPALVTKALDAYEHAPGQELASATGTWWGAVNAVTYILDHQVGRTQENRLYQAWLGERAKTKRKALNLALEFAA